MGTTLPLLRGRIGLEDALTEDKHILHELSYPEKRLQFWFLLYSSRQQIEGIVSRHLRLPKSAFRVGEVEEWIHGSFNACIPIYILTPEAHCPKLPQRALIRFALPYKVGEEFYPGNIDEKLRCEAATYLWLQRFCPTVPVPRLLGFGFPGGQSFTAVENESLWNRVIWHWRRSITWLASREVLPPQFAHRREGLLDFGYLVIEHVSDGRMLSKTWGDQRSDPKRRANLFRGLSRIMLTLAKVPMPRLGSWTMDNRGVLSLTNRPLTFVLHEQENMGFPTGMTPRAATTYTSAESYYLDLLACQDSRLRCQPNAIHSRSDGEEQLAALAGMRTLLPRLVSRQGRGPPFAMMLTDLHQSNIFVDDDWNIVRIIDLEWACTRPVEMLGPPYWLSSRGLEVIAFHLSKYETLYQEFVQCFAEEQDGGKRKEGEQHKESGNAQVDHTALMRACWDTGAYWFFQALDAPTTTAALFTDHLMPRYLKSNTAASRAEFSHVVAPFWDAGTDEFITKKIEDQHQYGLKIREEFAKAEAEGEAAPAAAVAEGRKE